MRGSKQDLPVALEVKAGTIRQIEWGGMSVEIGATIGEIDPGPYFKGLPDDRCQCPHWGYVVKGRLRYKFADREEIYQAGDVYYTPSGHTPVIEAGTEYVEFSPAAELQRTMEVVERNFAAATSA